MKQNIKILSLVLGCVILAAIGFRLSKVARDGEMKLKMRAGVTEARKRAGLLPIRPRRSLDAICHDLATRLGTGKMGLMQVQADAETAVAAIGGGSVFVALKELPKGRAYAKPAPSLITKAKDAIYSFSGYGQYTLADGGVQTCFILAEFPATRTSH